MLGQVLHRRCGRRRHDRRRPGYQPCTGAAGAAARTTRMRVSFSAISISVNPVSCRTAASARIAVGVDRNARHSATPTNSAIAVNAKP